MEKEKPGHCSIEYKVEEFDSIDEVKTCLEESLVFTDVPEKNVSGAKEAVPLKAGGGEPSKAVCHSADVTGLQAAAFDTPSSFLYGRWLFLSVVKNTEAELKRKLEFDDFQKRCQILERNITRVASSMHSDIEQAIVDFLEGGGCQGCPDTVILLGHGCRQKDKGGFLVLDNGFVSNEQLISIIRQWLQERQEPRLCKTQLCLFYCYAKEGETDTRVPHYQVVVYHKNPLSVMNKGKSGEPPAGFNTALRDVAKKRDIAMARAEVPEEKSMDIKANCVHESLEVDPMEILQSTG